MTLTANATDNQRIRLDSPQLDKGLPVMAALKNRHSEREWSDKQLSRQEISNLLWAANGVNRDNGKRTAPSALGKNDVDVYLVTPEAAYLYLPDSHELELLTKGDYRESVIGSQPGIGTPAVALVYTTTPSRFEIPDKTTSELMGFIDVGMASENVGIFCAGSGLVTVPRYTMDRDKLKEVLRLPEEAILVLNDLIGYSKSSE